jgi:copper(I)-binding protein
MFGMQTRRLLTVLGLLCVTSLLIAACAPSAGGIVIKDPFTRATPAGAASSPAAKTVELHETVDDNGVMKMEPRPEGWEIPARGTLQLKPGGKHIMLVGLTAPLEAGKKIRMTLNFEKAGARTIEVPVQALGGM